MDEKARLIQRLDDSRVKMRAVVARLDRDAEIYPGWTIKHVLAHITGWDEATTASLRGYLEGEDKAIVAYRGINDYNARSVETRQGLNHDQIVREWEAARIELKSAILAIPDGHFEREILYPWGQRSSMLGLIAVVYDHEAEHADEITRLKAFTADNPEKSE